MTAPVEAAAKPGPAALVRALRPRQWLKNVLVFAVPLAAGTLFRSGILLPTLASFVCFCLAASATYLVNDTLDRASDRVHPTKRYRPIAAGLVSPTMAITTSVVLFVAASVLAYVVRPALFWTVLTYVVATLAYSLRLKHEPVIELGLLTSGFLLRAVAGGTATGTPISKWFLIVAAFGSLFMASGKRYGELVSLGDDAESARRSLAGYTASYLRFVWALAVAVTVTAYCLWAFEVGATPSSAPWAVWSIAPFVLALLRYAVDVDAGKADAPEDVVLGDRVLQIVGLVWLVLFGLGAFGV
jgi:decaprenyl-phosphate phosphoribosyltransferase